MIIGIINPDHIRGARGRAAEIREVRAREAVGGAPNPHSDAVTTTDPQRRQRPGDRWSPPDCTRSVWAARGGASFAPCSGRYSGPCDVVIEPLAART